MTPSTWTFPSAIQANTFARILGRMTGDSVRVVNHQLRQWRVQRYSGSRWVNA